MSRIQRVAKTAIVLLWLGLLCAAYLWGKSRGYGVLDLVRVTYEHIAGHPYAPAAFIAAFALRPLILLPGVWLIILGGSLFGFWAGVIYTVIGVNVSANVAYLLGRFFTHDNMETDRGLGVLSRWRSLLDEQAFTSVLILRAVYTPFDIVNYGCGALSVLWRPYALATLLGLLPSLVAFVSFGASVDFAEFLRNYRHFSIAELFDMRQLAISAALLIVSLAVAWILHRRHRQRIAIGSGT